MVPGAAGVATHCPHCALQCGLTVAPEPVPTVLPRPFPASCGDLCDQGWTAFATNGQSRLTTPLIRAGGRLRPANWDTALDFAAARLHALRAAHGADAIGVRGGAALSTETAYLLAKFARRALGTVRLDHPGLAGIATAGAVAERAFGIDRGLPFPVTDLRAADTVLLAGTNLAESMPPLLHQLRRVIEVGGLIVVDPERTATARLAALHLRPRPGTDPLLTLGLLHCVVADGRLNKSYVDDRTAGFAQAWRVAQDWWPERVEQVTGVSVADQRTCARMLGRAQGAYVLTGRGTHRQRDAAAAVTGWINLSLALGLPGTPGSGFGCLTGQGNGRGVREQGRLPDSRTSEDRLRGMVVFGGRPVAADLDLLVVADTVLSEAAAAADVVFPVTRWAETTGTVTNLEGRLLLRPGAVAPPEGVRSELAVLHEIAIRLGRSAGEFPADPGAVFTELTRASMGGPADYSGASYARLASGEPLHWPILSPNHPGTPRLFQHGFGHRDGRARFGEVMLNPD
ncbi:MAG TPA: molybdopterin-dependent oxidoreductase [Pseudonocardiaceae bacterium]|nr:molybdopterin-dependent oxidoreductase [Pseudonocardiaceae bacterium]